MRENFPSSPAALPKRVLARNDMLRSFAVELSPEDVREFTELWEKEFGERLPDQEAKERAEKLVRFVLLMQRMGS